MPEKSKAQFYLLLSIIWMLITASKIARGESLFIIAVAAAPALWFIAISLICLDPIGHIKTRINFARLARQRRAAYQRFKADVKTGLIPADEFEETAKRVIE